MIDWTKPIEFVNDCSRERRSIEFVRMLKREGIDGAMCVVTCRRTGHESSDTYDCDTCYIRNVPPQRWERLVCSFRCQDGEVVHHLYRAEDFQLAYPKDDYQHIATTKVTIVEGEGIR